MKNLFASLLAGLSLLGAVHGSAMAQSKEASATAPTVQQVQAPRVESIDILKQDQAERSKDQPGNLAPTWRKVVDGENHYTPTQGLEAGVLVQAKAQFPGQSRPTTAGEAWRQYRNGPLTVIGGWLLVAAVAVLGAAYAIFGSIKLKEPKTGRVIQRFTPLERIAHWSVAISFVVLALTGLIMLFGKYVLLPVFGYTLFGWLAYASKNIHNFVGPLFTVSTLVVFAIFVRDNLPRLVDLKWLVRLGGLIGKGHASSGRFNAGEKLWFWLGVVLLGLIVSASGFVLDMIVPGMDYTRSTMQIANIIHLAAAVLVMAASLGHIYMGTIGMEGSYQAMRSGYVDDTWAKEHHDLWYEDIQTGKVDRIRAPEDASRIGSPAKAV